MNYKCPHCNHSSISTFKRFWLRRYMTFSCKSCGTELRIDRTQLSFSGLGIIMSWFFVTLGSSFLPFSGPVRIAVYLCLLYVVIAIFNIFVRFEPVRKAPC